MNHADLDYMKNLFASLLLIKNDLYQASIDPSSRKELVKAAIDKLDTALELPKGFVILPEEKTEQ